MYLTLSSLSPSLPGEGFRERLKIPGRGIAFGELTSFGLGRG